jgi:GNAT superfamily N-acetyltransferase
MSLKISTQKAIDYLSKDAVTYIDMLEPLHRGTAEIIYAERDGVILRERNSGACMIAMESIEQCRSVLHLEKYRLFAVHQKEIADWIRENRGFSHGFEVYQTAYLKKETIAGSFDAIRVLSSDYTDWIFDNYDAMNDRHYIETLIRRKQLWGIFDGDTLAGFIGEHLEGSIGLLEVLPAYRRKGYGYRLEAFLINHILEAGRIPFCQVVTDNASSLALQRKLGMKISGQTTTWLFD